MNKVSSQLQFLFLLFKVQATLARRLGGQGFGIPELAVLYAINQAPEGKIRPTDLAETVGLTASGVTRLILPLEKLGVVKRESHKMDGRSSVISMTKSGQGLFEDAIKWLELKMPTVIPDEHKKNLEGATALLQRVMQT